MKKSWLKQQIALYGNGAKATPGPWAHKVIALYNPPESTDELPRFDCSSYGGGEWIQKAKANAHLVAAAPDLLAALQALVSCHGAELDKLCQCNAPKAGCIDLARAAIEKAKGTP